VLYGRTVTDFPHVRRLFTDAYARLVAMKLVTARAGDYMRTATRDDRRYLKDTFFEAAARDIRWPGSSVTAAGYASSSTGTAHHPDTDPICCRTGTRHDEAPSGDQRQTVGSSPRQRAATSSSNAPPMIFSSERRKSRW
jgi:hypothetical protein